MSIIRGNCMKALKVIASVSILALAACSTSSSLVPSFGSSDGSQGQSTESTEEAREELSSLTEEVNSIESRFEEESRFYLGLPPIRERCSHLQKIEPIYRKMQKLMRQIDRQSGSYAPETVYIGSGSLWREYVADELDFKIDPYWADQCNR